MHFSNHGGLARLWDVASGKQIGADMKLEGRVYDAAFSPDGQKIVAAGSNRTVRLWNIGSCLDIPTDLFKLQVIVTTGYKLNIETSKIEVIPPEQWYKLKEEYNNKAKEHYKICRYPQYNFWSRFNMYEASKLRP